MEAVKTALALTWPPKRRGKGRKGTSKTNFSTPSLPISSLSRRALYRFLQQRSRLEIALSNLVSTTIRLAPTITRGIQLACSYPSREPLLQALLPRLPCQFPLNYDLVHGSLHNSSDAGVKLFGKSLVAGHGGSQSMSGTFILLIIQMKHL